MKKENIKDLLCRHITENTDRLYRLALSYVKNEQDAMDIVQEAAYKLLKSGENIREPGYIDTWLYRVTINTSLDFLRKRKRESVGLPDTEEGGEDNYDKIYIVAALDHLDEKSRTVLILRYFEDKTLQEIADILDENLSTVKSRLYAALRTLKKQLCSEGGDLTPCKR